MNKLCLLFIILLVGCNTPGSDEPSKEPKGLGNQIQMEATFTESEWNLVVELCESLEHKRDTLDLNFGGTQFNFFLVETQCNGTAYSRTSGGTGPAVLKLNGNATEFSLFSPNNYQGSIFDTVATDEVGEFAALCTYVKTDNDAPTDRKATHTMNGKNYQYGIAALPNSQVKGTVSTATQNAAVARFSTYRITTAAGSKDGMVVERAQLQSCGGDARVASSLESLNDSI